MIPTQMPARRLAPLVLATILSAAALPAAAACVGTMAVTSGAMKGGISGYDTCDFAVTLKAGEVLAPTLEAPADFQLVVIDPVEHDFAEGPLTAPRDGTYTVRVLQTRNAARKHPELRSFILSFGGAAAVAPEMSAAASVPPAAAGADLPAAGTVCEDSGPMSGASATLSGQIDGTGLCDYRFGAKAGETLTVEADAPGLDILLVAPVEATLTPGEALALPQDGDYTLRVLQSRAAAAKGGAPKRFSLAIGIE